MISTPSGLAELLDDIFPHVVAHALGIPAGTVQEVLHPVGSAVTRILGQLPAVLAGHRTQQPADVVPHPPPQIHPAKQTRHPAQQRLQLGRPHIYFNSPRHTRLNEQPQPRTRNPAGVLILQLHFSISPWSGGSFGV